MSKCTLAERSNRCLLFYTDFSLLQLIKWLYFGLLVTTISMSSCCTVRFWFEVKVRAQVFQLENFYQHFIISKTISLQTLF